MKKLYNSFIVSGIVLVSFINFSCNDKEKLNDEEGYFIELSGDNYAGAKSKAHWDETVNNSLVFCWDSDDTDMKAFVLRNGSNLYFTDEKHFSKIDITPDKTNNNISYLNITEGLKTPYENNDIIWSISPAPETNIKDNSVSFSLPSEFIMNNKQQSPTEHLKKYVFMSGCGTVKDGKSHICFNIYPTIFRFRLTNKDSEVLKISSVSFTGPFNHNAEATYAGNGNIEVKYSREEAQYSIKVISEEGLTINPGESAYMYGLVLPTTLSEDNVSLKIESNFGILSGEKIYNRIFMNDTGFTANTYKTLNIPLSRSGIIFDEVTIENFLPGGEFDIPFRE